VLRVQATVGSFDQSTQSGTVLLDDGTEIPFPSRAFAASGLRLLRFGQRVRVRLSADGLRVESLTIATLPHADTLSDT
jgi:2-phospho-L-lactate guanylyltransferase